MEDIKIGSSLTFGGYKWRVLDLQNNRALIITEDIIEQTQEKIKDIGLKEKMKTTVSEQQDFMEKNVVGGGGFGRPAVLM